MRSPRHGLGAAGKVGAVFLKMIFIISLRLFRKVVRASASLYLLNVDIHF